MPEHTVSDGDTLVSICEQHGFRSWEAIWFHEQNEELRKDRDDPGDLRAGDKVFVPDKLPKWVDCDTNKKHAFVLRSFPPIHIRLQLCDDLDEPYAECLYHLKIKEEVYEGVTDAEGVLERDVPHDSAGEAELTLVISDNPELNPTWKLELGPCDPHDTIEGAQSRLNNLGFHCGEVTGSMNDDTKAAVEAFQEAVMEMESPTGELDDATMAALASHHDIDHE